MEERNYENIPEDEFVPLECVSKEFIGLYEINKLVEVIDNNHIIVNIQIPYKSEYIS